MKVDYDELRDSYASELDRAVSFSGQDAHFYTRLKALALLDLARRRLGEPARLSALDVGCGVGLTDRHLAGRLGRLTGVDVAAAAVAEAARRNAGVRYEAYDGRRLPFGDREFDLVFAVNVVQVVEPAERPGMVAEMARVARPGGLVVAFEHNPWNPLTRLVVRRCSFGGDARMLRRREARALLAGAGLEPDESRYVVFFPWNGRRFRRLERRLGRVPLGAQYYVAARR
jgi:SAM-dependent methyltransferase